MLTHEETGQELRDCGIEQPVKFFQAFLIAGWHGQVGGPICQ